MRRGKSWAVMVTLVLAGCAASAPFRDMVGYVPPTSLPAQPKRTLVQDRPDQVWSNLLAVLERSDFEVDHIDSDRKLIVARYSGDPEPYVDCGSIVTHENGALGQISGSAENVALTYRLDDRPVLLKRALNLDSRIIIRLQEQRLGTVISTDTTYVVTKTVDIEKSSGIITEGNRETVSFSAGKRAEFSKGTACQPNGSLDVAVLQSLPNVIGSNEITRADLPIDLPTGTSGVGNSLSPVPSAVPPDAWNPADPGASSALDDSLDAAILPDRAHHVAPQTTEKDWVYANPGLPENSTSQAPPPSPSAVTVLTLLDRAGNDSVAADDPGSIVDQTTKTLLSTLDCEASEWHYCEIVKLTAPYRKLNIENAFGLTVNTADSFASQNIGSDLELDIRLPTFPSYLHIGYIEPNGVIDHVVPSTRLWAPDFSHRLRETGHVISGPSGLAMIVAVVSEQPLFPPGEVDREQAQEYLSTLKRRLAEIEASGEDRRIAASHLLINVE